jgi:hypothetical protein
MDNVNTADLTNSRCYFGSGSGYFLNCLILIRAKMDASTLIIYKGCCAFSRTTQNLHVRSLLKKEKKNAVSKIFRRARFNKWKVTSVEGL